MEVQKGLLPLLANFHGIDQLIGVGDELPPFDVYAPLLDLPRIFRTSLETIPAQIPYLFAERGLVQHWHETLKKVSSFCIGVNWHGRSTRGIHRQRDFPVECLASIAQVPGVQLVSLQKECLPQELIMHCGASSVLDLGLNIDQEQGAFMDTAAIIMNLDLVISSDTSMAHLVGALGAPIWLALPFMSNWRWLRNRNNCPWYPTMRLFRQQAAGDWTSVFSTIRDELHQLVRSRQL